MTTPIDGWKTYLTAAAGIGLVLFFHLRGDLGAEAALTACLGFLGLATIRHGIGNKE